MSKRFTTKNNRILALLSQGKTLDDLLLYMPVERADYRKEVAMYKPLYLDARTSKRPIPADLLLTINRLKAEEKEFRKQFDQYKTTADHIRVNPDGEKQYNKLVEQHQQFAQNMDKLFQAPNPVAYYLPVATARAVMESMDKLTKKLLDMLADLPNETGILLYEMNKDTAAQYSYTIPYKLTSSTLSGVLIANHTTETGKVQMGVMDFFHIDFSQPLPSAEGAPQIFSSLTVATLLFIHFFEVEKVVAVQPVVNARSSARVTLNDEHYDSELSYPVNVIDAHWYTTLIKDDPFLVKGHFRKQPYGPGLSQYKVRWISPYMKKGYHRQAKQPNSQAGDLLLSDSTL